MVSRTQRVALAKYELQRAMASFATKYELTSNEVTLALVQTTLWWQASVVDEERRESDPRHTDNTEEHLKEGQQ
jgi:hypothetical protein